MVPGQQAQTDFLKVSRIQSIKTKILIFALLATILPSFILGALSYLKNSKLLQSKISNELHNASVQTSGKLDLWLKERLYELRVFSSSYVVSENMVRLLSNPSTTIDGVVSTNHIKGYLASVCDKFNVYDELILIDLAGNPLMSSAKNPSAEPLPTRWLSKLEVNHSIKARTFYDDHDGTKKLLVAESIEASDGEPLGYLAAEIDLKAVGELLLSQANGLIDEIYLVDVNGKLLTSSHPIPTHLLKTNHNIRLPGESKEQQTPSSYIGYRKKAAVGLAHPIPTMGWTMVAEMERANAYSEFRSMRRITVLLVGGLMLTIGIFAYLFGHALVRPIQRLSNEAGRVAAGNLDVDIPVTGASEVSYLTQVFNHMVMSLRRGREELSDANQALMDTNKELHQLSITDGLTGLLNRKRIMEILDSEIYRSQRYGRPLSVVMLDIDHFKSINDTHGHQIGDEVIRQHADLYLGMVRDSDHVGRYGGEEFLILLPDSDQDSGLETAERIRKEIQSLDLSLNGKKLSTTVSIGVSSYPQHGDDADAIICSADEALYQAKTDGRNRVVVSDGVVCRDSTVVHLLADHKRVSEGSS